jgi:4-amino-4-deoxy-L-arabinose transferase-like glycosyltransferase
MGRRWHTPPTVTRDERLELLALLLLAAALRLAGLDLWPGFSGDEGYEAYYGWQTAEHLVFQQNPVRPYLGPWFLWVMAPFVGLLGAGPLAARLPVALLGVASVGLAWAVGRQLGGRRAGVAAGLWMATATFAVLFARLSMSVATLPFWALLAVWLLLRWVQAPGPGRAAAFGAAVGGAVSFHPQGLLLGPVAVVMALAMPAGRALARRPLEIGAAAVGFAALAWPVWVMILDQVGLGPGIDYSGTFQDETVQSTVLQRLARVPGQVAAGLTGTSTLRWLAGPANAAPAAWLAAAAGLGAATGVTLATLRRPEHPARGLAAGAAVAIGLTAVRAADFDLDAVGRVRYLLVALALVVPLLGWGLAQLPGRRGAVAIGAVAAANVAVLGAGFFAPMARGAVDPHPTFLPGAPDPKVAAADWVLERLGPDEEGLLFAGDGWTYWPMVALTGDRFPSDFVPEPTAHCAAELKRTDHRRRWFIDHAGWRWNRAIAACLATAGAPTEPALVVPGTDGRPVLLVWELAPGALGAAP